MSCQNRVVDVHPGHKTPTPDTFPTIPDPHGLFSNQEDSLCFSLCDFTKHAFAEHDSMCIATRLFYVCHPRRLAQAALSIVERSIQPALQHEMLPMGCSSRS